MAGGWSFCGDMDSEEPSGFTSKPGCFGQEVETFNTITTNSDKFPHPSTTTKQTKVSNCVPIHKHIRYYIISRLLLSTNTNRFSYYG